jgi:hypothetical protein
MTVRDAARHGHHRVVEQPAPLVRYIDRDFHEGEQCGPESTSQRNRYDGQQGQLHTRNIRLMRGTPANAEKAPQHDPNHSQKVHGTLLNT